MNSGNPDLSAIVGNGIALAALAVSIYSLWKSRKVEALQTQVAELDAKLKEFELAELREGLEARVEARVITVGKGHCIRFCNVGKKPARDVDFEILEERVAGLVLKDRVPFPELEYQKSFDETLIKAFGISGVYDVKVTWTDEVGNQQSKVSHISI